MTGGADPAADVSSSKSRAREAKRQLRELTFEADGAAGRVPARLYLPNGAVGRPLVLIGHGGAASKDTPRFVELSRRFAMELRLPVLIIDGPAHGDRAPRTGSREEDYRILQRAQVSHDAAQRFAEDWRAAASRSRELADVAEPGGWFGLSMGTMLGVTAVAAINTIRAAVFAAGGVPVPGGLAELTRVVEGEWAAEIIREVHGESERAWPVELAARQLAHADVLMLNNTADVVFPVDRVLRLFDLFPGGKRVAFWPGNHGHLPDEAIVMAIAHIRRILSNDAECSGSPQ